MEEDKKSERRIQVWSPTPAEKEKLITLWQEGNSAAAIGAIFGKTKNSIIGHLHRMKLPPREKAPIVRAERKKPNKKNSESHIVHRVMRGRIKPTLPNELPPPPGLNIKIHQLRDRHCRSIVGSDEHARPIYCGLHIKDGSSWCDYHHAVYTMPPRKRYA